MSAAPTTDWIQTASGKPFWPLEPRVEDIDIEDIAHALSMKCRYAGHCLRFYSVAQHSVLCSEIVPESAMMWALLHDATEAYLPDVARPVKKSLPGFKEIEARLARCIAERFGLSLPMPDAVKVADLRLLASEQRDLMAPPELSWDSTRGVELVPFEIVPASPSEAKAMFLRRFEELI